MNKVLVLTITLLLFFASVAVLVFPRSWLFQSREPMALIGANEAKEHYDTDATFGIFENEYVKIPQSLDVAYRNAIPQPANVLGIADIEKRIEVDLTNQKLYAYEGNQKVYEFLISSGKYGATPTGTFKIWTKIRSQKMSGGSVESGSYYYLPNVPYIMFFYNDDVAKWIGYGIHGAYWHNNFGHPMSHGCINMHPDDAAKVYYWALPELAGKSSILATDENPGTTVIIYGEAPWG